MILKATRKVFEKTPIYKLTLLQKKQIDFSKIPPDPWIASENFGIYNLHALLQDSKIWKNNAYFNRFEWIREFKNINNRLKVREVINFWIKESHNFFSSNFSQILWAPDILGTRIWNWLSFFDFYGISGKESFIKTLSNSINLQSIHLFRIWNDSKDYFIRLKAIKGILAFLIVTNKNNLKKWIEIFENNLSLQFADDNLHISRNPLIQLLILQDLIDVRNLLSYNNFASFSLNKYIQNIAPIIRMFRHDDGQIAKFNGNTHYDYSQQTISSNSIDMFLSLAQNNQPPHYILDSSGYIRSANNSGTLIMSTKKSITLNSVGIFDFSWSFRRNLIIESSSIIIEKNNKKYYKVLDNTKIKTLKSIKDKFITIENQFKNTDTNITRNIHMSNHSVNLKGEDIVNSQMNGYLIIEFLLNKNIEISKEGKVFILCINSKRTLTFQTDLDTRVNNNGIILYKKLTNQTRTHWEFSEIL